jgi:PKD repeat protein
VSRFLESSSVNRKRFVMFDSKMKSSLETNRLWRSSIHSHSTRVGNTSTRGGFAGFICLLCLLTSAHGGPIQLGSTNVNTGASISIPLTVDSGTLPLGDYTVNFSYDTNVLVYTGVTGGAGEFAAAPLPGTNTFGELSLSGLNGSSLSSPTGVTLVARIGFTVIGSPGTNSPLAFNSASADDTDGNPISTTSVNGLVQINGIPPVANFSGAPTTGLVPLIVAFTNASSGTITNSLWDFGDGNTSNTTAATLDHTYGIAGTYTVTLIANGQAGSSTNTRSNYIVAQNPASLLINPASLSFGTVAVGFTSNLNFSVINTGDATLSGTASSAAPFSVTSGAIYNVAGGQTQAVTVTFTPSSEVAFTGSVFFASNGGDSTNTVDGTGAILPVASFIGTPLTGAVSLVVTFTDSSSGTITNRFWNFGDGNTSNTLSTTVAHTYNAAGTNTVSLTIFGPVGTNFQARSNYIVVQTLPQLSVTPASRNYGSLTIGLTNSLAFSVINTGQAPLSGTATSDAPFSVTGGASYNVAGGQTQTVTVAFAPTSAVASSGSVFFASDGGDSTNAVTGTGLTPGSISVTPASQDFGTIATGTTAQLSFVVTNSGGTAVSNGTATVGAPFTVVSGATFSVPGLGTSNITVRFAPVSAGAFTNSVAFSTANGGATNSTVIGTGAIVPVASFIGTPTTGAVSLAVTFTDSSTGTITNRFWNFGDGNTSNTLATSVAHTYNAAGTNTVTLTIVGPVGTNVQTRNNYIVVQTLPQLVVTPASRDYGSVTIGLSNSLAFSVINTGQASLSGTASSAAPFSVTGGASYNVAGGQTQTVTVAFAPSSAVASTGSVIFASDGGDSTNAVTGTGLTPGSISVTPASQDFGAIATGTTAQLSFVVTNSGGTSVSNGTATALGAPFTVVSGASFSVPGFGTSNITVRFAPVSAGAFTNKVAFSTANGGVFTNTVVGTGAIVPTASFTGTPTNGALPLAVTFTDNSTGTITNRFWDFGDGTTTNTVATSVGHSYSVAGSNTVSLTATGPVGTNTQTRSNYIVAHNPPVANFSATPTLGPVALAVTFTDSSAGNITNRFWNFGDGHTTNTVATSLGHTYNAVGTNTVTLTVYGMGGWCATNRAGYIIVTNIVAELIPPQLSVDVPTDFEVFTNAGLTVSGSASDASGINGVTVNGSSASVAGTNWSRSVTLSEGTNTFTVIATDASVSLNTATQTVHAVLMVNHPPQITAELVVTNALINNGTTSVVVAGDTNIFLVSATEPDGNSLNYQWAFGDGHGGNSSVHIVGHVYTNDCGPYNASVTVSDSELSTNSTRTVVVACDMQITKMQTKLSFSKSNADSCSFTASIGLPTGFNLAGKAVTVSIGGAQSSFTLDAKGKGKGVNAQGSCAFKFNKKTSDWTISVKFGKTNLLEYLAGAGLVNATVAKPGTNVVLTTAVLIDNEAFATDKTLVYTATAGKSGSAR